MSVFITIEGVEGAGKSTLITALYRALTDKGNDVVITREPGGTEAGKGIREILLSPSSKLHADAELLLFCADRAQHVHEIIRPSLTAGKIVISDRYFYSTIAYQGFGRGVDRDKLNFLTAIATGGLLPDVVLLLDLPPEEGLRRARKRADASGASQDWNRFEEEQLPFHRSVREGFLTLAREDAGRFEILDASKPAELIAAQALQRIEGLQK